MTYLCYLNHQNMKKLSHFFKIGATLIYHLQSRSKNKTKRLLLMYKLFVSIENLWHLFTANCLQQILRPFYQSLNFGAAYTLADMWLQAYSSWTICTHRITFSKKKWLLWKFYNCFKKFMDNILVVKETVLTVQMKPLVLAMLFFVSERKMW